MKTLIEKSKYLNLVAVLTLLVTFVLALFWGVVKAFKTWVEIIASTGQSEKISLLIIKLIDAFLIAAVLYVLATSLYKMFISDIDVPQDMAARNLPEFKSKLSTLIVLVVAIRFVETFFEASVPALDILWLSIATALVTTSLIIFSYLGVNKEK